MSPSETKSSIGESAALCALPLALFAFYLYTLFPTLAPYRDSGDMASSAFSLGIAHPPGYPLYVLTGRAVSGFLSLGNVAYRLNLWSAACAAAAAGLLALFLKRAGLGLFAVLSAALLLALTPAYWALAQVSEMYALNALAAAAVINLWLASPAPRALCLCAFLLGLGLGNHQTLLFLIPASAWVFWRSGLRDKSAYACGAAFFFLGLAIYAFLPLRAFQDPVLNWGEPTNLRNFLRVLTRADMGGVRLHPERPAGIAGFFQAGPNALFALKAFLSQANWAGALLTLWGAAAVYKKPWGQGVLAGLALSGPFFILWANLPPGDPQSLPILEPHLVLPALLWAALIGAALGDLISRLARILGRPPAALALGLLVAGAASYQILRWWPDKNHRFNYSTYDYGRNLLASMEPGSLLFDPDDTTAFVLNYLNVCYGKRRDIIPILYYRTFWGYRQLKKRAPEILPPREFASSGELLEGLFVYNLGLGRAMYADLPQKAPPPYLAYPSGFVYRILPPGSSEDGKAEREPPAQSSGDPAAPEARRRRLQNSIMKLELASIRPPPSHEFFTRQAYSYGAWDLNNLGVEALKDGKLDAAENLLRRGLVMKPEMSEGWSNLGNIFFARQRYGAAAACYRTALRIDAKPVHHYNAGRALWADRQLEEAERHYQAAIRLGRLPEASNDLGLLYFRSGRLPQALEFWKETVRAAPGYAPAWFNLGLGYASAERPAEAIEAFTRFKALAASAEDLKDAERWLAVLRRKIK